MKILLKKNEKLKKLYSKAGKQWDINIGKETETKIKKSQFSAKQQSVEKRQETKACGTRKTIGH